VTVRVEHIGEATCWLVRGKHRFGAMGGHTASLCVYGAKTRREALDRAAEASWFAPSEACQVPNPLAASGSSREDAVPAPKPKQEAFL
jgi:hypothetical protein